MNIYHCYCVYNTQYLITLDFFLTSSGHWSTLQMTIAAVSMIYFCCRPRPVPSSPRGQSPSLRRPLMTLKVWLSFIRVISAPVKFSFIRVIVKYLERLLLSLQVIKRSDFYFSTMTWPSALLAFFQLPYRFCRTVKHYLFRRDQSLCRSTHTDFTLFCKMTPVLLRSNYTLHLNLIRLLW